jgi:hypothetical protein
MAQATSIVLADGQATPANVTFAPEKVTPDVSTFVDRATGIASRFRRLTTRFKPSQNGGQNQAAFEVSIPSWGTLPSGATGVVYTLRASVQLKLPDGCTDAERKDLYAFVKNGLANTLIQGNCRDLDPLY